MKARLPIAVTVSGRRIVCRFAQPSKAPDETASTLLPAAKETERRILLLRNAPSPNASTGSPLYEAGTVISAEPGIYLPGRFGVRIEDVLVLEEGGCRDITQSPKNLIVL